MSSYRRLADRSPALADCAIAPDRVMPGSRIGAWLAGGLPAAAEVRTAGGGCDLLGFLAVVPDGRPGQGRDHPVAAVLALATAGGGAGCRSSPAVSGWARRGPGRGPGGAAPPAARPRAPR